MKFPHRIIAVCALLAAAFAVPVAAIAASPGTQAAIDKLGESMGIDNRTGEIKLSGQADKGYYRAYVCPTMAAASLTVRAIPKPSKRPGTVARQVAAMKAALRQQRCVPARGTFHVTGLGPEVMIEHGYEAEENWVAVEARNARGQVVGLIIDSSPYAPLQ